MFVLSTKFSAVDRGIAAVLAVAMVCWAVGAHYTAQAAGLIDVSDTLSTSQPGVVSDHTLAFTMPTGSAIDQDDEIRITMPAGFTIPALVADDFDVEVNATDIDSTGWTVGVASQVITVTAGATFAAAAGDDLLIEIGTNATNEATGSNQITNNAATGSYEVLIEIYDEGTTLQDSNSTVIAIVDQVVVTADVDPIFDFFVSGVAAATALDGDTTDVTTSTTTIPFGTLSPGTDVTAAQRLSVVTNAQGGFAVTVFTNQQLTATNGSDIDSFADGGDQATPLAWASPTGTIGTEDEYGHWGIRSSDETDLTLDFSTNDTYVALPLAASPLEVFTSLGVTDGTNSPLDEGFTDVMFKAEIMSFQEAADDYTATLTYVATPTF